MQNMACFSGTTKKVIFHYENMACFLGTSKVEQSDLLCNMACDFRHHRKLSVLMPFVQKQKGPSTSACIFQSSECVAAIIEMWKY